MSALGQLRRGVAFDRMPDGERRTATRAALQSLLREVRDHAPLYRRDMARIEALIDETDNTRFFAGYRELTPLTKADLAERLDQVLTDPELSLARVRMFDEEHSEGLDVLRTAAGDHQVLKTSGTSGQVVYIVDRVDNIRKAMGLVLYRGIFRPLLQRKLWPILVPLVRPLFQWVRQRRRDRSGPSRAKRQGPGYHPGFGERAVRFFRPSILIFVHRGNRSVYRGTTSYSQPWWIRALVHRRLISHEESLESILAQTEWLQPELIFGLPSRLEWLADAQIDGRLNIDPLAIYVGGETLHAEILARYREAWPQALVINAYGATETKAIATACAECGELHVLEDVVYLELECDDGTPAPVGEVADRAYCTGLWNRVTPVLRYEMSDRIVPLADAGCRWRTQRIQVRGREPAFLWARHRERGDWIPLNGRMLKESLVAIELCRGFSVRYEMPGVLEVTLVAEQGAQPEFLRSSARAAVQELVEEQGSLPEVLFKDVIIDVIDADTWHREGGKLNTIRATVQPVEDSNGA